jgi:hypothetical protein
MGVALVWVGLAAGGPARAQQSPYLPSPVGAARIMPDPLPCGPSQPPPNLIPGPVSPLAAPMGPPPCLDLPADHSSAFQCENYVKEFGFYFQPGVQFLFRQRLGAGEIAVLDTIGRSGPPLLGPREMALLNDANKDVAFLFSLLPRDLQNALVREAARLGIPLSGGLVPFIQRMEQITGLDSGLPPVDRNHVALQNNNLVPAMDVGYRGTFGLLWEGQAIEYTGFFAFENDKSIRKNRPFGLDVNFFNAPPGFEGNNGLWLQADRVGMTFGSSLWSNELNYRSWNVGITGLDFIAGVRYVEQRENLDIITDDDGLTFPLSNGNPDPELVASYLVRTRNHLVMGQLGCEYTLPLCCWLTFGTTWKGAWGANIAQTENELIRGDGLVGFDSNQSSTHFAQMYDIGGYFELNLLERLRLKTGINAYWLTGLATAVDQVDFNLGANPNVHQPPHFPVVPTNPFGLIEDAPHIFANLVSRFVQRDIINTLDAQNIIRRVQQEPHGKQNYSGSVFYWGPMLELEFLF